MIQGAVERTERWFIARGIPHFIADYSASEDVFTRALPALALVVLVEVVGAANLSWPAWANALAVAGGLALVLTVWAAVNVARGAPALSRPSDVGTVELGVFVVAPALLPLVFGGQATSALVTAAGNLVLLGIIYLGTSYGVVPMSRWAARRLVHQLGSLFGLLIRALPLLLLFVTFLFVNPDVWGVAARLYGLLFVATVSLFVLMGTAFLVARIPHELGRLSGFSTWEEVCRVVAGTPAEQLTGSVSSDGAPAPPLTRRQSVNVGLLVLFGQAVQIVLVSLTVGAFFVVFGLLVMRLDTVESWSAGTPHVLATLHVGGEVVHVTEELLRVSGFLAAFTGLYFTVVALTDQTYRREFFETVADEMRQAFAVRAVYLAARESGPGSGAGLAAHH